MPRIEEEAQHNNHLPNPYALVITWMLYKAASSYLAKNHDLPLPIQTVQKVIDVATVAAIILHLSVRGAAKIYEALATPASKITEGRAEQPANSSEIAIG